MERTVYRHNLWNHLNCIIYRLIFFYIYISCLLLLKDKDPTGMSFSSSPEAEVVSKKKKEPKDCTSPIEIPTAGAATTAG